MKRKYEKPVVDLVGFEMNRSIATTVDCGGGLLDSEGNPFYEGDKSCQIIVYCVENTSSDFVS